jgi:hypothetical protein
MEERQRSTNLEVEEMRRVLILVRPFVPALSRWNAVAPRYMAILASPHSSGFEKARALDSLGEMLHQIRETQAAFADATATASTHSRVEDLRHSMLRLEARLAAVVTGFGFEDGRDTGGGVPARAGPAPAH